MYQHYQSKTVSSDELDDLLRRVARQQGQYGRFASMIVADEVSEADDDEIDAWLMGLLDLLCLPDEDERWSCPSISGLDVIAAVDQLGLTLGTVYETPQRDEKVIELDTEVETDAQAWATVAALPDWVQERYGKLVRAGVARGNGIR